MSKATAVTNLDSPRFLWQLLASQLTDLSIPSMDRASPGLSLIVCPSNRGSPISPKVIARSDSLTSSSNPNIAAG